MPEPIVYYHLGLGKTASTYLQQKFFPKLEGVHYIPSTQYWKAKDIISRSSQQRFLVSREFDRQMQDEASRFAKDFPGAKPFLIMRRQDAWARSLYKVFIKNGHDFHFTEFLDLANDKGFYKMEDFNYMAKIHFLEQLFPEPPMVIIYDQLKSDPLQVMQQIASFTNSTFKEDSISLKAKHVSYTDQQLLFIKKLNQGLPLKGKNIFQKVVRYPALAMGKLLGPADQQLVQPDQLKAVQEYFAEDWEAVLQYAGTS